MKPIQMVDLASQYQRLKAEIDPAIQSVLNQANYINGAPVKQFAKDLARKLAGVVQIQMPENEDVNSLFVKNGSQWFEERIENEVNV